MAVCYPSLMPIPKDAVTVPQAAKMLGLAASSVRAAIHDGRLRAIPFAELDLDERLAGRITFIERGEVERYRQESLSGPGRRGRPRTRDAAPDDERHA